MSGITDNIEIKSNNDFHTSRVLEDKAEITSELEQKLKDKIQSLPTSPGVYQFKNTIGKIIYIGKAKNLRNRVRSYFQSNRYTDAKTNAMVGKIADIEVIVVDSESEAFILEDTLIKKYKPKYNVLLRDDKSYPYIRVTNESYPRIFPTRKLVKDGSKYIGPFTEVKSLKQLMRILRSLFYIRSCDYNITEESIQRKKYKICLDYHIHKCQGPCEGLISQKLYNENIKQSIQILNGKTKNIERIFENKMNELSEQMKYEEAASMRNKLELLKDYTSKQKIVTPDIIDRDVFGIARVNDDACTIVFKIREGKLIGKRHYIIKKAIALSDSEVIQRTIEQWYLECDFIPDEIYLPCEPEQMEYFADWISTKSGKGITIQIPKIGDKKKLVAMAAANAEYILREYHIAITKREQSIPRQLQSLQRDLRLKKPPIRIECFDNSHIQGSEFVSSMVVFVDGKPKKSEYRKFKIRTVDKSDDFAAMQEVVKRRYSRILEEKAILPDLIIIDGGKGQLSFAYNTLKDLGLSETIQVISLAKRLEEIFFPGESESLILPKTSSSLKLLQQVRDEAHRFAINFHRQLRRKRTLQTELTNIEGIGKKTATKLLIQYGSVENIKNATLDELASVVGIKLAGRIADYFKLNG